MGQPKTILEWLEQFPPFVCYYLARKGLKTGEHKTAKEIAKDSGLDVRMVFRLSQRISWRGVKIEVIDAYCRGCGINFFHTKKKFNYLNFPYKAYLRLIAEGKILKPFRHLDSPEGTNLNHNKRERFNMLCRKVAQKRNGNGT